MMKVMLDDGAFMPQRAHSQDAGYDLKTPVCVTVPAHGSAVIDTGVHMLIKEGWCGVLMSKSGLNVKHNLTGTGLIDASYVGSICAKLYNHGDEDYRFARGDKVIQLVLMPCGSEELELVKELPDTERGSNGFGSTGRN